MADPTIVSQGRDVELFDRLPVRRNGTLRTSAADASNDSRSLGPADPVGEAFAFQRFAGIQEPLPMTGSQIISVPVKQRQPNNASRPFLHLGVSGGFTYDLAKTVSAGGDCTSATVSNVKLNRVALDGGRSYMVTANSFLANGGDNFVTFAAITGPRLDGGADLQALANCLAAFGLVAPPSIDRVNELP